MPLPVNNQLFRMVYNSWSGIGDWLLPARCLVCTARGGAGRDLCGQCHAALPWNQPACARCALPLPAGESAERCGACQRARGSLLQVRAALVYAAPVDRLLRRFKFHQDLAAGRLLAQLMVEALQQAPRPQAVVPVSLHRLRLRQRGYDQALELARPLARELGLPLVEGLQRVRATHAQSQLDASARRRNLRGAFVARPGLPAHVALVDDVMTTGATLRAAAMALRGAGVKRVDAWVCARVP